MQSTVHEIFMDYNGVVNMLAAPDENLGKVYGSYIAKMLDRNEGELRAPDAHSFLKSPYGRFGMEQYDRVFGKYLQNGTKVHNYVKALQFCLDKNVLIEMGSGSIITNDAARLGLQSDAKAQDYLKFNSRNLLLAYRVDIVRKGNGYLVRAGRQGKGKAIEAASGKYIPMIYPQKCFEVFTSWALEGIVDIRLADNRVSSLSYGYLLDDLGVLYPNPKPQARKYPAGNGWVEGSMSFPTLAGNSIDINFIKGVQGFSRWQAAS